MRIAFPFRGVAACRHVLLLVLVLFAASAASAAEAPVPLTAFFGNPGVSGAKLSPDGKRLALLVNNESGHDQLGVVDLADNSIKVVAVLRMPTSAISNGSTTAGWSTIRATRTPRRARSASRPGCSR